jgi:hypothetical protein
VREVICSVETRAPIRAHVHARVKCVSHQRPKESCLHTQNPPLQSPLSLPEHCLESPGSVHLPVDNGMFYTRARALTHARTHTYLHLLVDSGTIDNSIEPFPLSVFEKPSR